MFIVNYFMLSWDKSESYQLSIYFIPHSHKLPVLVLIFA